MAKEIKALVKLRVAGGAATPAPPVGNNLGQHQIKIMDFCNQFNAKTAHLKGQVVPVIVTVYQDKSFDFVIKTPDVTSLIKKKLGLAKGSSRPNADKVGKISWNDIEEIAKIKMPDLNAMDIDQAKRIIAGSARSMGVVVVD